MLSFLLNNISVLMPIKACWECVRSLVPVLIVAFGLLSCTYWYSVSHLQELKVLNFSTGLVECIISNQLERIRTIPTADVAILGDSSGLMGINPSVLSKKLSLNVQGYCTIAYAGPKSYASMIEKMMQNGKRPGKIILALHPAQFCRHPDWEAWATLVDKELSNLPPPKPSLLNSMYLRLKLNERLIYIPMPGLYGMYYGSISNLAHDINTTNGSAIDPSNLTLYLNKAVPSAQDIKPMPISEMLAKVSTELPKEPPKEHPYLANELYKESLDVLKKTLDKYGISDVYIAWSPVLGYKPEDVPDIVNSMKLTYQQLGVNPEKNAIETNLFAMPNTLFASTTHLSIFGKGVYTQILTENIRKKLFPTESE